MKKYDKILEELKNNLRATYCDNICDYDSGYVCDIISEIADRNIDIYHEDLFEWAKGNYTYIDDATAELGRPNTIIKEIQQGQFYRNEQELYDNLEEMLLLFVYDYLDKNEIDLTDEQIENLESEIGSMDNNNQLEEIIDYINELKEDESEVDE